MIKKYHNLGGRKMTDIQKESKKLYEDALYNHLLRNGHTAEQAKAELKKHLSSLHRLYSV